MATANKIATKEYCNTLKPGSFTSDLTAGVTATEASAAGFTHNSTPALKCVKETNLAVPTVTFNAVDLTPYLFSAVNQETTGDINGVSSSGQGPDWFRRLAIGSVVMLDTETFKLKLFAFSYLTDIQNGGYILDSSGNTISKFKDYDGTRFTPLGIVVGVPANEYLERDNIPELYGTMCGYAGVSCLTVMSLRNCTGALTGLNQYANLGNYASWMLNKQNDFLEAAGQLGMDPIDIYNPIAAICKNPMYDVYTNGLMLSEFQANTNRYWSIFPMYIANSANALSSTDPISIRSDPAGALNLSTTSAAMTSITGLKYQMPLAITTIAGKGMGYPGTTNMSATNLNSMAVTGIARCLPFDAAHYDSRCTGTSYELFYTGRVRDFRVSSGVSDLTDGTPCRSNLAVAKTGFFNATYPQRLLCSPYYGDGTGFNETIGGQNNGLLFNYDDFRNYVERTAVGICNSLYNEDYPSSDDVDTRTFCLPTGATYEAFLLTQKELTNIDLSFWGQTQLYQLIRSYTGNNDRYFSLYTPSLYELFKTTARWRHITMHIQQLSSFLSANEMILTGGGLASCEMDDTLLSDGTYLEWVNEQISAGSWPEAIGRQLNALVTSFNATTAAGSIYKTCGRLGVHCLHSSPTATTDRNSMVLPGPYICSCPYLWHNAQYNSSTMYGYCELIPFIRIPVDYSHAMPVVQAIWNTETIV